MTNSHTGRTRISEPYFEGQLGSACCSAQSKVYASLMRIVPQKNDLRMDKPRLADKHRFAQGTAELLQAEGSVTARIAHVGQPDAGFWRHKTLAGIEDAGEG